MFDLNVALVRIFRAGSVWHSPGVVFILTSYYYSPRIAEPASQVQLCRKGSNAHLYTTRGPRYRERMTPARVVLCGCVQKMSTSLSHMPDASAVGCTGTATRNRMRMALPRRAATRFAVKSIQLSDPVV